MRHTVRVREGIGSSRCFVRAVCAAADEDGYLLSLLPSGEATSAAAAVVAENYQMRLGTRESHQCGGGDGIGDSAAANKVNKANEDKAGSSVSFALLLLLLSPPLGFVARSCVTPRDQNLVTMLLLLPVVV